MYLLTIFGQVVIIFLDDASSIGVTQNSRYLMFGCRDRIVKVFDIETRELVQSYTNAGRRKSFYKERFG